MASSITTGKGAVVSVTQTAQKIEIVPSIGSAGGSKNASYVKVWNTGGTNTAYAIVNAEAADIAVATAIPIAPLGDFTFVGQPIKSLVLVCDTGETTTVNYGAY